MNCKSFKVKKKKKRNGSNYNIVPLKLSAGNLISFSFYSFAPPGKKIVIVDYFDKYINSIGLRKRPELSFLK